MVEFIKEVLFLLALVAVVSLAIIGTLWIVDVAFKRILLYYRVYDNFLQFMLDKQRKKKGA